MHTDTPQHPRPSLEGASPLEPGGLAAIALGAAVGPLLAAANVYLGLKVGFTTDGSLVAALVTVTLLQPLSRLLPLQASARLTNLAQSAASAGAFCAVAGLTNAVPAMALVGVEASPWLLVPWVCSLGLLGVCIATPLRRSAVEDPQLRFPDAVACVEALRTLHAEAGEARRGARALLCAAGLGGTVVWLQQVGLPWLGWTLPARTLLPGALRAFPCERLSLGLAWSPALLGIGAIIGLRVALSLALGAVLGFVVGGPWLAAAGVIEPTGTRAVIGWTVWPALGLIVSGGLAAVLARAGLIGRALGMLGASASSPDRGAVPARWYLAGLIAATAGSALVAHLAFAVPLWQSLIALALALPLTAIAIRAVGETNLAPANNLAKATQLLYAGLAPGQVVTNLAAAGVTAGSAQVGCEVMSDLKAGALLGNHPRHLFLAQLLGVLLSAGGAVAAYLLLIRELPLGEEALPAPTAVAWSALATGLAGGSGALPTGAALAAWLAIPVGALLALAAARWPRAPLPSPVAVGLGAIFAPSLSATILLGALAAAALSRLAPALWSRNRALWSGGLIIGESLLALAAAALSLAGLL